MSQSFFPRLINKPIEDSGVYISFAHQKRAVLLDLGDISPLSARDVLKISHVFISHTHVDHFIGFDNLLRIFMGKNKTVHFYGPKGFLDNIQGKLTGYTWNLVDKHTNQLIFYGTEVSERYIKTQKYICKKCFVPLSPPVKHPFNGILLKEPELIVRCAILDHGIPCLGFSVTERFHVNIITSRFKKLGLSIGPWLKKFKEALLNKESLSTEFKIKCSENKIKSFKLGELADKIAAITPGQKISYITDVKYSSPNIQKIIPLVEDSDHLFIESVFLEKDKDNCLEKFHLTAKQAGKIARASQAKKITLFHFSSRYEKNDYKELEAAFYKEAGEMFMKSL